MASSELHLYLADHAAASRAAVAAFRRVARSFAQPEERVELVVLAEEVADDHNDLLSLMDALGASRNPLADRATWLAERLSRLKPNGRVLGRSSLSDIVEVEGLRAAVQTKKACWEVLRAVALGDSRLDRASIEERIASAEDQAERLHDIELRTVQRAVAEKRIA